MLFKKFYSKHLKRGPATTPERVKHNENNGSSDLQIDQIGHQKNISKQNSTVVTLWKEIDSGYKDAFQNGSGEDYYQYAEEYLDAFEDDFSDGEKKKSEDGFITISEKYHTDKGTMGYILGVDISPDISAAITPYWTKIRVVYW